MNFAIAGHHVVTIAYITAAILILSLLLPITRGLATFIIKALWYLVKKAFGAIASFIHKFGSTILKAHLVYLHNFMPRGAVMPTVETKTVRRQ